MVTLARDFSSVAACNLQWSRHVCGATRLSSMGAATTMPATRHGAT
jgi:hypothetical protein